MKAVLEEELNEEETKQVKIIKRYQNRKLYDTERSCYVTLNEIAELIKKGGDVKVIDNKTKRDLTSLTLAQIIFEEEKKRKRLLPLGLLKNIIQSSGGSLVEFWKKSVNTGVSSISQAHDELEGLFQKLVAKGILSKDDRQHLLQNLRGFSQKSLEEIQKRIDEAVREAINRFGPGSNMRDEFTQLQEKVSLLEKQIKKLAPK